jgi:hypothetical protein
LKTCANCGQEKPISEFRRHLGHGDGYDAVCKDDMRLADRAKKARVEAFLPSTNAKTHEELGRRLRG